MTTNRPLRVFLCHSSNDKPAVRELYEQLILEGWLDVWLDEMKLLPGQEWDIEIEEAVENADAVIVFLSNNSITKRGYVQKELNSVLNIAEYNPEGEIFIVPILLEPCEIPRRLKRYQYQEYFNDVPRAFSRLLSSLETRANSIGIDVEEIKASIQKQKQEKRIRQEVEKKIRREEEEKLIQIAEEEYRKSFEAKANHDRIRRLKTEERKKAWLETVNRIKFKKIIPIIGLIVIVYILFLIGKSFFNYYPILFAPTKELATQNVTDTPQVNTLLPTEAVSTENQIFAVPLKTSQEPTKLSLTLNIITFLALLSGLIGLIVPLFPGLTVMWLVTLLYAVAMKIYGVMDWLNWLLFLFITLLMISGNILDNIIISNNMRRNNIPWSSILASFAAGLFGSAIFTPLIGMVASPVGLFLAEWHRIKDRQSALENTKTWLAGWSGSILARLAIGVLIILLWSIWVLT